MLESQRAYTASLNAVAAAHIRYILDRIRLFLDLELLVVDDGGFWPRLYDDRYQPQPDCLFPSVPGPVSGELPIGVWYSHRVRRMLDVSAGSPSVYSEQPEPQLEDETPEELAPAEQP